MRCTEFSDDGKPSVEQLGVLALAAGVAAIIGTVLLHGHLPPALALFLTPATWTLFALVPWNHAADPLRTRQFGFLAVLSALLIFVAVPILVGPTNILALTALVLAVRIRSPYLAIAALVMAAVARISAQSSVGVVPPAVSVGWHICLLVVLVGLWCLLTYLRARTSRRPVNLEVPEPAAG